MQTTQVPHSVQFTVAEVTPATKRLSEIGLKAAVERATRTKALVCPEEARQVLEQADFHPLIAAAFIAFKQHYPLVLSPDMIWLTILQGVAQHIQNHSETLRHRLVRHETKLELVVETSGLPQTSAEMLAVTREFQDLIRKHVPADKQFLFGTEFSTTTDTDRIVQSIALMDAFQPYFDYVMYCICGIPSVTLEGTPDDWRLLKSKVEGLNTSDLELSWWTEQLLPLCGHFIRAVEGEADRKHWQNICKLIERYGTEDLNGWLLKFIPYLKHGKNEPPIHRNPIVALQEYPEPDPDRKLYAWDPCMCTSDMLPSGLSRAPVTVGYRGETRNDKVEFVAGFLGVTQSPTDLSLRPLSGWAICEGAGIDKLIARLQVEHEVLPPVKTDPYEMNRSFDGFLPGDVWRFYTETGGAIIKFTAPPVTCRILPLAEINEVWDRVAAGDEAKALHNEGKFSVGELKERKDFLWAYGSLLRIADLGDGRWYVFGHNAHVHRGLARRTGEWPSREEREARAIYLWTGERQEESFTLVANRFSEWLAMLLNGRLPGISE